MLFFSPRPQQQQQRLVFQCKRRFLLSCSIHLSIRVTVVKSVTSSPGLTTPHWDVVVEQRGADLVVRAGDRGDSSVVFLTGGRQRSADG
ncbi:hypothetical protein PBY51_003608 [Eleginops maclovinus]|uniref:Uncharacterized protein n=1 Tax=Eleginops maclovinus TaxID=56733 RepID=A0AAN7Y0D5_ELEMC|nr:hypothetical protein PBY51_003608 [Eleginops maclovinus]